MSLEFRVRGPLGVLRDGVALEIRAPRLRALAVALLGEPCPVLTHPRGYQMCVDGRHADLLGELHELTGAHPLHERFWAQTRPPLDVVVDHLRDRRVLLILDNCQSAEAREAFRAVGQKGSAHMATMFWAMSAVFLGCRDVAVHACAVYREEAEATGAEWGPVWNVEALAWTATATGTYQDAAVLLGAAHRPREAMGVAMIGLAPFHAAHLQAEDGAGPQPAPAPVACKINHRSNPNGLNGGDRVRRQIRVEQESDRAASRRASRSDAGDRRSARRWRAARPEGEKRS